MWCRLMLYFRVFARRMSRSATVPFLGRIPVPQRSFPKFHGMISFADPLPLNSVLSYRYKNMAGMGHSRRSPSPNSLPHNLFADPHALNLYTTIFYKNTG